MDTYLVLLLIAVVTVNLVDLSGFIDTLKRWIWKWVWKKGKPYQDFDFRPFQCSYCMTHHIGLIYLLIAGWTLPSYAWLLVLCFLTPVIKDAILTIRAALQKIIDTVWWYLNL